MSSTPPSPLPFEQARAFARTLGLATGTDWTRYCSDGYPSLPPRPKGVPVLPNKIHLYRAQWISWHDWLSGERSGTAAASAPRSRLPAYVVAWIDETRRTTGATPAVVGCDAPGQYEVRNAEEPKAVRFTKVDFLRRALHLAEKPDKEIGSKPRD